MGKAPTSARGVRPGRILRMELDARGWTHEDLADFIGQPAKVVGDIVRGTQRITPETALELAHAFGTSPDLWTNLETNYRAWLARRGKRSA